MSKEAGCTHNKKSADETGISSDLSAAKGLRAGSADAIVTPRHGHTGRIAGKISRSQTIIST